MNKLEHHDRLEKVDIERLKYAYCNHAYHDRPEHNRKSDKWASGHTLVRLGHRLALRALGQAVVQRQEGNVKCAVVAKDNHLFELVLAEGRDQSQAIEEPAESKRDRFKQ